MKKFNTQVNIEHYKDKVYDSLERFISYYYQISEAINLNPRTILEIGIGNKTVSNYLNQRGFEITTCDFDKNLHPDVVADIRKLPFKDNTFDVVMACEVLEHIPWVDVPKALSELSRVSCQYVIISVPHGYISYTELVIRPLFKNIFRIPYIHLFFRIPPYNKSWTFNGEHYWELGYKNYSIRVFINLLLEYFNIISQKYPILNIYHNFFILRKKI